MGLTVFRRLQFKRPNEGQPVAPAVRLNTHGGRPMAEPPMAILTTFPLHT